MIRLGPAKAGADRFAALVRGAREGLAGSRRAVLTLDPRHGGDANGEVLARLAQRNPRLVAGLDTPVLDAVKARWAQGGVRTGLAELAWYAARALGVELAARLRSGRYVTNTALTTARKRAAGLSTTPGIATGTLAVALDNARVSVE